MKWILNTLALVAAFLLVGCSSHAPSASRFMAAKPNSISFGFGGGGFLGDDNSHRENKGKNEVYKYSELRYLLDGVLFLRNDHFLFGIDFGEHSFVRLSLGFANDYLGAQFWGSPIVLNEDESTKWMRPFGIMLIEQYPIRPNFRVGVSQFFAHNSYDGVLDECCSLKFDHYVKYYKELGVGAYVAYDAYSLEFRYGNELGSDNQRFYIEFSVMN